MIRQSVTGTRHQRSTSRQWNGLSIEPTIGRRCFIIYQSVISTLYNSDGCISAGKLVHTGIGRQFPRGSGVKTYSGVVRSISKWSRPSPRRRSSQGPAGQQLVLGYQVTHETTVNHSDTCLIRGKRTVLGIASIVVKFLSYLRVNGNYKNTRLGCNGDAIKIDICNQISKPQGGYFIR